MSKIQIKLRLKDFIQSPVALGSQLGRQLLADLRAIVAEYPTNTVFEVSFADIQIMDATCARESLVALAIIERAKKGFYLTDIENEDIIFNIKCASIAKGQPLLCVSGKKFHWIGKKNTALVEEVILHVYSKSEISSAVLSNELSISIPNASIRLKKMLTDGYLLANKIQSSSGGHEYVYFPLVSANSLH
jgi:hypothetical protein